MANTTDKFIKHKTGLLNLAEGLCILYLRLFPSADLRRMRLARRLILHRTS